MVLDITNTIMSCSTLDAFFFLQGGEGTITIVGMEGKE